MKITLKAGVGELLFGMKEKDVKNTYGEPDRHFRDEDKNVIWLYNDKKLRLTFYQDEDFRLGYIIVSGRDSELFSENIIGRPWNEVESLAFAKGIKGFEKEVFDTVENYFNETNWIIFQVEFNEVIKVELGAIINNQDEFDWKFKA